MLLQLLQHQKELLLEVIDVFISRRDLRQLQYIALSCKCLHKIISNLDYIKHAIGLQLQLSMIKHSIHRVLLDDMKSSVSLHYNDMRKTVHSFYTYSNHEDPRKYRGISDFSLCTNDSSYKYSYIRVASRVSIHPDENIILPAWVYDNNMIFFTSNTIDDDNVDAIEDIY